MGLKMYITACDMVCKVFLSYDKIPCNAFYQAEVSNSKKVLSAQQLLGQ